MYVHMHMWQNISGAILLFPPFPSFRFRCLRLGSSFQKSHMHEDATTLEKMRVGAMWPTATRNSGGSQRGIHYSRVSTVYVYVYICMRIYSQSNASGIISGLSVHTGWSASVLHFSFIFLLLSLFVRSIFTLFFLHCVLHHMQMCVWYSVCVSSLAAFQTSGSLVAL